MEQALSWRFQPTTKEDFEFASKYNLDIIKVIECDELPYSGEGAHVNSDFLDGLNKEKAIAEIIRYLEKYNLGKSEVQYKLRDWLFSRQRYWGEPFPTVHYSDGAIKKLLQTMNCQYCYL